MTIAADARTESELTDQAEQRGWLSTARQFARRNPLGAAGGLVIVVMILVAVFADVIAPYNPVANAFDRMHEPPSLENWFGTDQFGRDVFSRIVYGARTALIVGFVSSFVGASLGLILGVASAYFGGRTDLIFQRVLDVCMAFPIIILALAVIGNAMHTSSTRWKIRSVRPPKYARCPM